MKNQSCLLLLFVFILSLCTCDAQELISNENYSFKKGDPYGTGKWYMGREIAHVMGFQGMEWLDRPEREQEENVAKLLRNMKINADDVIADIGAGSGYHVFKMARKAKKGLVYAVDIQEEMLAALEKNKVKGAFKNVEIVKGSEKGVNLPENTFDKVLMVDVYHEFNFPEEMMTSIKKSLRSDGKIYLIEYRAEDVNVPIKKVHKMAEVQAIKEMKAVGLKLEENISNLPWQHCMVFVKE